MKKKTFHKALLYWISILIVLFYSYAGAVELHRTVSHSYSVPTGAQITLMAGTGRVFITGWDSLDLKIRITRKVWAETKEQANKLIDRMLVKIEEGNNSILIRECYGSGKRFRISDLFHRSFWYNMGWNRGSVDYELMIPAYVQLRIACREGDVTVQDGQGRGNWIIEADEGDVECNRIRFSGLNIKSEEGDVRLTDLVSIESGKLRVRADEGSIDVTNCHTTDMDIRSEEGNVDLKNSRSLRFKIFSKEGDIKAGFSPLKQGQYYVGSDEGSIHIAIPATSNLAFQARTKEGIIRSDFNLLQDMIKSGKQSSGTVGLSEAFLKANTIEGNIGIMRW